MLLARKKNVTGTATPSQMKTGYPKMESLTYSTRNPNQLQKYKNSVKANLGKSYSSFQKEKIATNHANVHNPIAEARYRKSEENDRKFYETKQKIYAKLKK